MRHELGGEGMAAKKLPGINCQTSELSSGRVVSELAGSEKTRENEDAGGRQ